MNTQKQQVIEERMDQLEKRVEQLALHIEHTHRHHSNKLIGIGVILIIFMVFQLSGLRVLPFVSTVLKYPLNQNEQNSAQKQLTGIDQLKKAVLPDQGFTVNVAWSDVGKRLIETGVIDEQKLTQAVGGKLTADQLAYLTDGSKNTITVNSQNAHFWVNLLWALGLANKNPILDNNEMVSGDTPLANFASTGGYTIGKKPGDKLYNSVSLISLTPEQQLKVKEIADTTFRVCCGNATSFPDCNHGMAVLGLAELMVSQNIPTDQIYKTILEFNSFWFPQAYLDIAYSFQKKDIVWNRVDAKEVMGANYSSAMGYRKIREEVGNVPGLSQPATGCGA